MKKYIVYVKEIHFQPVFIEAETQEKAIEAVMEGSGDFRKATEYSETLDSTEWQVTESGESLESE